MVLNLKDLRPDQHGRVGGKAANLAAMMKARLQVPPGFCVTAAAFDDFLNSCPKREELSRILSQLTVERLDQVTELSKHATACLADALIPPQVEAAVLTAWREQGAERVYAVRSSATVEDAAEHSFAGQFESFLNVRGKDALLAAIKECWRSLFSARALAYQAKEDLPVKKAAMAVVVQEMVPADAAGVLFTVDPVSGNAGRVVIEGTPGLGGQLVSGKVNPDRVVLDKATLRVMEQRRTTEAPSLDGVLTRRLGKLARKVERLFGGPQDLEWAVAGGKVFLLQARPVTSTALAKSWEDRQVWTNLNTGEVLPDVMTPMTWSVLQLLLAPLFRSVLQYHGADFRRGPLAGLVAGRAYFNVNTGLAVLKPFRFVLRRIPNLVQALGGGQATDDQQALADIPDEDLPDLGFRWPRFILSWPGSLYLLIRHSPRRGDAWCARLKSQTDAQVGLDVKSMSTPALVKSFDRLIQESFRGWDLLYLVTQAPALPVFRKACRDWLNDPDLTLGYRLFGALGGLPETEAGLALWRLAVLGHAGRQTEAELLSEDGWSPVSERLRQTEHGRQFLAAWDAFMSEHGHHCRGELELFNSRWSETPDYILSLVRSYLRAIGQSNPLEKQRRLAEERRQLTEQCCQRLKNPVKRWIFSWSLRRAQRLAVNREEWKNQAVRHLTVLRRMLVLLGTRLLKEGRLAQPDDIFFLEVAELQSAADSQAPFDARAVIARRREEYEKNLTLTPPPVVIGRFDPNTQAAPVADANATVLAGIPVFPGTVTGRAKVILRANDHEQVLPGEILVAPFTDPAWTPYFVTAAGVVMEQGGILSHGSIVAREYGLPAVTNAGSATRIIRTGDLVQVDGNHGRVTVLARGSNR